jgi:hypothetical protein
MICEIIQKKGEKGSGGGAEAFRPGVSYVCGKALKVAMMNIASNSWESAASEMLLTSELNDRVQKPYYHAVISWHKHENPSVGQMFEAAQHMIKSLGLEDHQVVIGAHGDTERDHIHIIANTVHPKTGKVWSKSHDHMKAEKACREIETKQGWSHDRGRFDFDVDESGEVELKPNVEAWEKKKADRESGKRPKTSGARKFEKGTGFETFEHGIPDALRDRFAEALGGAFDWQSLHEALGEMGLTYYKSGSGARVGILGSKEFAKASAFGSKFSITKLEKSLGPYEEPEREYQNDLKDDQKDIGKAEGSVFEEYKKATSASSFKMTLLRRIYTNLHLDPLISREIKFVDLKDAPPQITFRDSSTIVDRGKDIGTSKNTRTTRATMIAMAKAKGWSSIKPSGEPDFVQSLALEAAQAGIYVQGVPDDLRAKCDAIVERVEKVQARIEAEANAAQREALGDIEDRDQAIDKNKNERADRAHEEEAMTAEARAVVDALEGGRDPVRTALRTVAREEETKIKASLPDRRTVSKPQAAPDADKDGRAGTRQIKRTFYENDQHELDRMREVHIDEIAARGGWSYDPKHKDGHNDKAGQNFRTYVRGSETIKASKKGAVWVWTNNKTGDDGSVIDLWLQDNGGKTLGDARKEFRQIIGSDTLTFAPKTSGKREVERAQDHTEARRRWEEAPFIEDRRTYAEDRGISKATLKRFPDQVRCGVFGGIYFAHRNIETGDVQGFEQRWEKDGKANTARFAKGGIKTTTVLGDTKTASRMIILESGLDALALTEIEKREDTIYVSTGGGFGPKTEDAIRTLAEGREILLSGFDNDKAGKTMHEKIAGVLPGLKRYAPPSKVEGVNSPCKDWLDVLNAQKKAAAMPRPGPIEEEVPSVEAVQETPAIEEPKSEPIEQPEDEFDTPNFP